MLHKWLKLKVVTPIIPLGIALIMGSLCMPRGLSHSRDRHKTEDAADKGRVYNRRPESYSRDTRTIRHLQRRLRVKNSALTPIFAITEKEAEQKLIRKLVSSLDESQGVMADLSVSLQSIGFCEERLSSAESEALSEALQPLRFPDEIYELSVARVVGSDVRKEQENGVIEAAHRLVRDTIGLGRYYEVFRECRRHQKTLEQARLEELKQELGRSQSIFYRALHFSVEQQEQMARLIEEARRELDPFAATVDDPEPDIMSSVLNERGEIPELHESSETIDSAAGSSSPEIAQEREAAEKASGELWRKFQSIMTQEQREFFSAHRDELIRFGTEVFGSDIDYVITAEQPLDNLG